MSFAASTLTVRRRESESGRVSSRRRSAGSIVPTVVVLLTCLTIVTRGTQGYTTRLGLDWPALVAEAASATLIILGTLSLVLGKAQLNGAGYLVAAFTGFASVVAIATTELNEEMATLGLRTLTLAPLTIFAIQAINLSQGQRLAIARALLLVVLANCAVAFRQAISGLDASELAAVAANGSTYQVGDQTRLIGLQPTGQELSIVVGATAAWGLCQIIFYGFRRAGILVVFATAASTVVAVLVLQRSILLGLGLSLIVLLLVQLFRPSTAHDVGQKLSVARRLLVVLVLAVATIPIVSTIAPAQFDEAVSRILSISNLGSDVSWSVRSASTMPIALDLFFANPWGYGTGTTGSVGAAYSSSTPLASHPYGGVWTDNGYMFVALQVGLFGVVLWLVALISWALMGRLTREHQVAPWSAAAVLLFVGGSMLTGSFWGLSSTMTLVLLFSCIDGQRPANVPQEAIHGG